MMLRTMLMLLFIGGSTLAADEDKPRTLFQFDTADAAKQWSTVNDGVMGGRSEGQFKITDKKTMQFFGTLSLENNGGFASVRTRPTKLDLKKGDSLILKVRGDGREYSLNLYVPRRLIAFSYRASFQTKKDEWIEVTVPLTKFVATSFGRVVKNQELDPSEVNGLGILLGDKKAGPFTLEVESIKVRAGAKVGAAMKVQRDIAYVENGHERHKLDVYAPSESKDHPIIVWIHGGGWRRGDKSAVQHKPQAFVDNGFVFVSVNYRFVPDVTVNEMTGDIAKAIKWVHDHAGDYGGDPKTILVAGHSAGAHLAALVCTDESYLTAEGLSLSHIKGCIPVDTAVYDIAKQINGRGKLRAELYTAAFGEDENGQKQLSPITHVAKDKGIPAFCILHVASRPDSTAQSQAFAKALTDAGVDATTVSGEDKTHGTINLELGLPDDKVTKALFAFLDGVVKPRTLGHFKAKVDKTFTPAKAEAVFGKPDRNIGSGLIIYEYGLSDGTKMWLGFPGYNKITYAKHVQQDETTEDLPLK